MADITYDVKITDTQGASGFLSGDTVYMNNVRMNIVFTNNLDIKTPPNKNPFDIDTYAMQNWDRRVGNTNYSGVTNPGITISGKIDLNELDDTYQTTSYGYTSTGERIITPFILFKLITYPTTWYITDGRFIKHLLNQTEPLAGVSQATIKTSDYAPVSPDYGIPVIIKTGQVSISTNNIVDYSLTLVEDKDPKLTEHLP